MIPSFYIYIYFLSSNWLPLFLPNQALFCLIGRYAGCKPTYGSLIGNNIRDVRNWSRRISRSKSCHRMCFYKNNHLKTDLDGYYSHWRRTTLSDKKKRRRRRREECVCMCKIYKNWATVARPLHIEYRKGYGLKCQWCRLLQCFCHGCFFSKSSPSACILVTKSKVKSKASEWKSLQDKTLTHFYPMAKSAAWV